MSIKIFYSSHDTTRNSDTRHRCMPLLGVMQSDCLVLLQEQNKLLQSKRCLYFLQMLIMKRSLNVFNISIIFCQDEQKRIRLIQLQIRYLQNIDDLLLFEFSMPIIMFMTSLLFMRKYEALAYFVFKVLNKYINKS